MTENAPRVALSLLRKDFRDVLLKELKAKNEEWRMRNPSTGGVIGAA